MDDLFSSAQNLVASADEHLGELFQLIAGVVNQNAERVVERNPQTGEQVHKLRLLGEIHPKVAVRIFNISTELRAALDHGVYASAAALGKKPDPGNTKFPFGDTEAELTREIDRRCSDVPSDIRAVFERLRPYETGNPALWRLNKLRNVKDHRRLVLPMASLSGMKIKAKLTRTRPNLGDLTLTAPFSQEGAADNELIYLRLPDGLEAKYELDVAFHIVFGDVKHLSGLDVLKVLEEAAAAVDEALAAIELKTLKLLREPVG